jgi:hypothetical protein
MAKELFGDDAGKSFDGDDEAGAFFRGECLITGKDDLATLWGVKCGIVLSAIPDYIREGTTREFDFESPPNFANFPPVFREFHNSNILPIADLIRPQSVPPPPSDRQRYEQIAPLLRTVIEELYCFEPMEFMREEIQDELRTILTWFRGWTRGASWDECFHGKTIPNPQTCSTMARRF